MEVEQQMKEAQDNLEDWVRRAVQVTQKELFKGDNARLDSDDVQKINKIDQALKKNGRQGIWGSVQYSLYTEETEDGEQVRIDTFGVPLIPSDLDGISVDVTEKERERYNNVLSEYGVKVSERIEKQFEEWIES